ncbi:MAG: zinc ribbon domain-containing protein [Eubacterium sp.]|nr:zinc ribbon domain-containing protein [Eubacterium sp.]
MGFTALYCPNCGASIQLDNSREFGFCQYCGTKIVQDKIVVEHRGSISIDRTNEINNILTRAKQFFEQGDYFNAEIYYNKVLDIDVNNIQANYGVQQINQITNSPNLQLNVTTGRMYDSNAKVKVIIDGVKQGDISARNPGLYRLSEGTHSIVLYIRFVPSTKQELRIEIKDKYSKVNYEVHCAIGNRITIR